MVELVSSLRTIGRRGAAVAGALVRTWPAPPPRLLPVPPPPSPISGAELARVIEGEIIPRLMLAHAPRRSTSSPGIDAVGPRTLEAFARLTLSSEGPALTEYVEALIAGGLPLERALVELLAPTARRLGDDWNEDLISFTDVTVGLSRLQHVMRALRVSHPTHPAEPGARAVFLMPAPGEQHTFGLFLLEDRFRRAGWRTWLDTAATRHEAARTVRLDHFDVFGLSATRDTPVEVIAATVAGVRAASCNRGLFVMVGGRLFDESPELVDEVGADACSASADDALFVADNAVKPAALA